jgi:type II secretory pathway pseudopilin PulG
MRQDDRFSCGVGLIEIVVVIAVIGVTFLGFYQLIALSIRPIQESARASQAAYLAQEGIEAVRTLRNESWGSNITPLVDEANYYPGVSAGNWTLAATDPGPIDGLYRRTVTVHEVFRDADDNINPTGTLDEKTKKVTARVSWDERGKGKEVTLTTYVTDFLSN